MARCQLGACDSEDYSRKLTVSMSRDLLSCQLYYRFG
jgi:hypothetical protein